MLSKFDDYPIHQTSEPIAVPASSDRNVYDRYWFNGITEDTYFGIGAALYPNLGILDCGLSIVRDGEQRPALHSEPELCPEGGRRDHAERRIAGDRSRLHARACRHPGRHDPMTGWRQAA